MEVGKNPYLRRGTALPVLLGITRMLQTIHRAYLALSTPQLSSWAPEALWSVNAIVGSTQSGRCQAPPTANCASLGCTAPEDNPESSVPEAQVLLSRVGPARLAFATRAMPAQIALIVTLVSQGQIVLCVLLANTKIRSGRVSASNAPENASAVSDTPFLKNSVANRVFPENTRTSEVRCRALSVGKAFSRSQKHQVMLPTVSATLGSMPRQCKSRHRTCANLVTQARSRTWCPWKPARLAPPICTQHQGRSDCKTAYAMLDSMVLKVAHVNLAREDRGRRQDLPASRDADATPGTQVNQMLEAFASPAG